MVSALDALKQRDPGLLRKALLRCVTIGGMSIEDALGISERLTVGLKREDFLAAVSSRRTVTSKPGKCDGCGSK